MKAVLFAGFLYSKKVALERALKRLEEEFGMADKLSEPYDFTFTDYYENEMGKKLEKRFAVFESYVKRSELADIKLFTIGVEKELTVDGKRSVNIDPGYLTGSNIVLATTKEFPHRIYLKKGIFAEITLLFSRSNCKSLEWTYPDFKTRKTCDFFLSVRSEVIKKSPKAL